MFLDVLGKGFCQHELAAVRQWTLVRVCCADPGRPVSGSDM